MPKRPRQHIIGDEASLAVQAVVAKAGFAVEAIRNDYGEDLLVQTSHAGEIDASRLWLQVKGTRAIHNYSRSNNEFAYTVPFDHAIKWVRSSDPVVVVLWDLVNNIGYFSKPAQQVDEWHQRTTAKKTTTLFFASTDTFTAGTVARFAWESRFARYHALLLGVRAAMEDHEHDSTAYERVGMLETVLVMDFLKLIGVLAQNADHDEFYVTPTARNAFSSAYINSEVDDNEERFMASGALTILSHAQDISGGAGLTTCTLLSGAGMLVSVLGLRKFL